MLTIIAAKSKGAFCIVIDPEMIKMDGVYTAARNGGF
jgi:hypothetical protein